MLNSIVSGITTNIYNDFGDGYEIYTEAMEQGFLQPCFFVSNFTTKVSLVFNKKYKQENKFCIKFYPLDTNSNFSNNDVITRLMLILEYINLNGDVNDELLHGTNMEYKYIDGVLNFFVNYNTFFYRVEDITPMDTITNNTTL